jgi:hypothetical protein
LADLFIAELRDGVPFALGVLRVSTERRNWTNLPVEGVYSIDYLMGGNRLNVKSLGRQSVLLLIARIREQAGNALFRSTGAGNAASGHTLLSAGFHFDSVYKSIYLICKRLIGTGRTLHDPVFGSAI